MPYYGRQVARLKGIGKYINWNQGGGPKKAGLGPQINVTTWGRRVISRRTNNCCCDPIELTSVQMSLPGVDRGSPVQDSTRNIGTDISWNQWLPGNEAGGGYVGPPRNNIDATGTIRSTTQIYAIFTFNKPISASSPPYKFNPSLPPGTKLEVIGLKKVDNSVLSSPLGAPVPVNTINPPGVDYYIRESNTTPVIQIPGGTEVRTFAETNQRLTDGSRFLIDSAVVTGPIGTLLENELNSSKARLLPDMQSGLNNSDISGANVNTRWYEFPVQTGTSAYGAFNRRLDYEKRGGFAPENPINTVSGTAQNPNWVFSETNHFLGNIFGVYTKTLKHAQNQYPFNSDLQATNINPKLDELNIRLVQSNPATQVGSTANYSTLVENYSADAAYISTGEVPWLGYEHALFINITSIMQIMLKNPTANAVPYNPNASLPPVPTINNPPQARFYAGNPLSLINGSATDVSGSAATNGVIRPSNGTGVGFSANADWTNSSFNSNGKYATYAKDIGINTSPITPIFKSGPWQISSIDGSSIGLPNEGRLPAWCDATWNQIGLAAPTTPCGRILYNGVTLDSGGLFPDTLANSGAFPESQPFSTGIASITGKGNSYHILFYGHVIEKMRQLTYAGFSSYIVRDILSSKYNCGNDGFDGPVADIVIPSGDRRITTTDNTTEAGLLTFDSDAPSYPLPAAATPALPPTANPSPPANPPSGPSPPGPINPNPDPVVPPAPISPPTDGDESGGDESGGGGAVPVPTPINPGGGFGGGGGLGSF